MFILEGISNLFGMMAVVPVIPFAAAWLIGYGIVKNRKQAAGIAMDITTLFLIAAVAALFNRLFSSGFGFYGILLFLLLSAGLIGSAQNRIKGKVNVPKLSRALWRMSFLVLSFFYILFMIWGISKQILTA
ncbi:DUF3397 domain-containing protein [Paenibacillus gansuensis]|uniref:DUF3397 domain-containing protein n=1 Tax=Paenibacillus gansuensis TaxID=306542 RepID=A0ABW5PCF2_9BACL